MNACVICRDPNPTSNTTCSEETHMPDTYEYKTNDGRTVGLFDHVYIKHDGYCRAQITDTRVDDTDAMLLVECEDGPNWVYETEIFAEEPAR